MKATAGYVLSIDQGTTGTNVMIFDHDGGVNTKAYSEFTQHFPKPGWVEHDADEIWNVTQRVIGEALENGGVKAIEIQAIGITSQREDDHWWWNQWRGFRSRVGGQGLEDRAYRSWGLCRRDQYAFVKPGPGAASSTCITRSISGPEPGCTGFLATALP